MNRRTLHFTLSGVLCLCLLAWTSAGQAQARAPGTPEQLRLDIKAARPSQLVLASVASAAASGLSYLLIAQLPVDRHGPPVLPIAGSLLCLPLVPTVAAATAQGTGRHYHIEGSYWRAWGFSLVAAAAGAGGGFLLGDSLGRSDAGVALYTIGFASLGAGVGATFGYNSAARTRLERFTRHLSPSISASSDKRGALLTVSGAF